MVEQAPFLALLSTDGCHLCEDAKRLLNDLQITFELVDIIDDEELIAAYGDKIPVLMFEGAQQALFWPFNNEQIEQYLSFYGISSTQ
ncbi:MAG: glutaredoxin family protein [Gammaproteobacteria bacterium]|nr:glutaredoxin family protein [Gammaproteobacteria bacterium]